jgi:hypothetical protein
MVHTVPLATDDPFEPLKRIGGSISQHLCRGVNGFGSSLEIIFHYLCPGANGLSAAPEVIFHHLCREVDVSCSTPEILDTARALKRNDSKYQRDNCNDQCE